jgi:hypothetical protein
MMRALWQSEAWRYRWLPLLLAVVGTVALYWLQEMAIFRRHALLLIGNFVRHQCGGNGAGTAPPLGSGAADVRAGALLRDLQL